jgi:hypothetical protein
MARVVKVQPFVDHNWAIGVDYSSEVIGEGDAEFTLQLDPGSGNTPIETGFSQ